MSTQAGRGRSGLRPEPSQASVRPIAFGSVALALVFHTLVVVTIVRQPLPIDPRTLRGVSLIWPLHHDTVHRLGPGADFFATYHAGVTLGSAQDPYDSRESPRVTPYAFPFRYLPIVGSTIGALVSKLAPGLAYRSWIAGLELVLLASVIATLRSRARIELRALCACALLLSSPYFLELHMGQFTFVTTALALAGVLLLQTRTRGAGLVGAAAFAASALLKVFTLAAIPALLRYARGRAAALLAIVAVIGLNAGYFHAHPQSFRSFMLTNFGSASPGFHGGNYGFLYLVFQAVRGAVAATHQNLLWAVIPLFQLAVYAITIAYVARYRPSLISGTLAMLLAHMLVYKQVWEHHCSGIVLCAVVLLLQADVARAANSLALRRVGLACLLLLIVPTPFVLIDDLNPAIDDPSEHWSAVARWVLPMSKALPTLVLWLASLHQVRHEPRSEDSPATAPAAASALASQ